MDRQKQDQKCALLLFLFSVRGRQADINGLRSVVCGPQSARAFAPAEEAEPC